MKSLAKPNQQLAIRRGEAGTADYVPHLTLADVKRLQATVAQNRNGDRDSLLVATLFDGCLRCSEACGITPQDLQHDENGWQVEVYGKGGKHSVAAISPSLAAQLQAFAYRHDVAPDEPIFHISRKRVFQIVKSGFTRAGIAKPAGVGTVHVLRHSGAIERLKATGNPKAVQEQLRHRSALMTLRYLKTIGHEEAIAEQQKVDFGW